MSRVSRVAVLLVMAFLVGSLEVYAHHSFAAEFDGSQLISVAGTLTKLEWLNPHGWFYVDVIDKDGKVSNWGFEIGSPNILRRADENMREYFVQNIGKPIRVVGCPHKTSSNKGAAELVKFHDGRVVPMGNKRYTGDLDSREVLDALK